MKREKPDFKPLFIGNDYDKYSVHSERSYGSKLGQKCVIFLSLVSF